MRKVYFLISVLVTLFPITKALAADPINIIVNPPTQGINPTTPIGTIIGNLITIILILGVIGVLLMFLIGAFEWITSGGDKDAISKARGRILNAVIGLIILSLAFLLSNILGNIVGINIPNLTIPSLDSGSPIPPNSYGHIGGQGY